jgi:hypothetical protein
VGAPQLEASLVALHTLSGHDGSEDR